MRDRRNWRRGGRGGFDQKTHNWMKFSIERKKAAVESALMPL